MKKLCIDYSHHKSSRSYKLQQTDYDAAIGALLEMRNETIVTRVRPYARAIGTVMTPEEHAALHSALDEDSNAEHPHSILFHPIHANVNDDQSDVVGFLGAGAAWDGTYRHSRYRSLTPPLLVNR